MKKLPCLAVIVIGLFAGGCTIPISPLMFLLKDQPAPLHQPTPDSPQPATPMPLAPQSPVDTTTGNV